MHILSSSNFTNQGVPLEYLSYLNSKTELRVGDGKIQRKEMIGEENGFAELSTCDGNSIMTVQNASKEQ